MKDGWEVKNLGKVCEYFNGVAHEHCIDDNGKYKLINSKFISSNGLNFKSSSQGLFLLKRGDITMCLSDVPNGKTLAKCFLVDKDETYTLNQRICVVRSTRMLEKFLYYQLNRNQHLLNFDNGENQTNLRLNQVLECPLYLPPISEQQRIVAILDQAFEGIAKARANAEQNLQNARALFESHLQSVFTQRGDEWVETTLENVVELNKNQHKTSNALPYVGMEDIESNTGSFIGSKEARKVKSNTFHFNNSHVLYGRLRPYLNKVLLPDFEGHCSTEVFPIRPNSNLDRNFLFYWLTLNSTKEKINATCTGARMPRANMNDVLTFDFSYPPLNIQKIIVDNLIELSKETQHLETLYQRKIELLDELKKSLLQQAFAGEL